MRPTSGRAACFRMARRRRPRRTRPTNNDEKGPGMTATKKFTTKTLTRFLIEEQRRYNHATGGFTALINDVRLACKRIARVIGKGALADALGPAGSVNVQGETQMKLD